jgi:hypothetical protein
MLGAFYVHLDDRDGRTALLLPNLVESPDGNAHCVFRSSTSGVAKTVVGA